MLYIKLFFVYIAYTPDHIPAAHIPVYIPATYRPQDQKQQLYIYQDAHRTNSSSTTAARNTSPRCTWYNMQQAPNRNP